VSLQLLKFCIPFTASRDEIDMSLFLGAILRTTGSNITTPSTYALRMHCPVLSCSSNTTCIYIGDKARSKVSSCTIRSLMFGLRPAVFTENKVNISRARTIWALSRQSLQIGGYCRWLEQHVVLTPFSPLFSNCYAVRATLSMNWFYWQRRQPSTNLTYDTFYLLI
jgi:hypothetical protein